MQSHRTCSSSDGRVSMYTSESSPPSTHRRRRGAVSALSIMRIALLFFIATHAQISVASRTFDASSHRYNRNSLPDNAYSDTDALALLQTGASTDLHVAHSSSSTAPPPCQSSGQPCPGYDEMIGGASMCAQLRCCYVSATKQCLEAKGAVLYHAEAA